MKSKSIEDFQIFFRIKYFEIELRLLKYNSLLKWLIKPFFLAILGYTTSRESTKRKIPYYEEVRIIREENEFARNLRRHWSLLVKQDQKKFLFYELEKLRNDNKL